VLHGQVVALEAREIDRQTRSGWSVTALGRLQLVSDADARAALAATVTLSWPPLSSEQAFRIQAAQVSGRRRERGYGVGGESSAGRRHSPISAQALSAGRGDRARYRW
jgi:Pyridoxamine 5'-phosphate oxidase